MKFATPLDNLGTIKDHSMIPYLIHSTTASLAYIDPNTVHTVFSGSLPMLLAGLTVILAVLVWPLIVVRHYLSKWFGFSPKFSWAVISIAMVVLLAGIVVVYLLSYR